MSRKLWQIDYLTTLQKRDEVMAPTEEYFNEGEYVWECQICETEPIEGSYFCHQCGQRISRED